MTEYEKIHGQIMAAIERNPADFAAYDDLFGLCRVAEGEDFAAAHAWNHEMRDKLNVELVILARTGRLDAAQKFADLQKRSLLFGAPHFFDDYLQAVEYDRPLAKKFYLPRRHYLKRYVDAYQEVLEGKLEFLSISMPKRSGKLIAYDCPVLTPDGFKPHGELRPGDYVYGIDGKPKRVLYKHPDSYATHRVIFSNGEEILTSAEHEWMVYDKRHNRYEIVETQDMERSGLKHGPMLNRWRYIMPLLPPIVGTEKKLPVDPYTLGAWLGDGTTTKPLMTNDTRDYPILEKMIRAGYPVMSCYIDKNYGTFVCSFKNLKEDLRSVGMCHRSDKKNKHIPEQYFTASFCQRVELLSGLVDTDGYVEKGKHRVHISTTLPRLRDDIIRLVSTFGLDCRCVTDKAKVSTSGIVGRSDVYTISFAPDFELLTVLERKHNTPTPLPRRITVRKIERLDEPIPGNCITVEGGVYRVGYRQVLTHNSQLGINFTCMLSGKYPEKSTLMEGTGDDLVNSFYKGCLEYLLLPNDYCFYQVFPDRKLVQTNADTKIFNLDAKSRFPTVMCRSIDARQVGLSEASSLLYMDDMVEGREEAKNRKRLDEKWEVISGDVVGRAIEGTPIVVCGTRYSLYDPMGRLQEEMQKQGKRMKIMETPALDPITDESNFEYVRDGKKVFTTQFFRDQRTMLSAEQWESEFQQQPFEAKGLLFPKQDLNYYYELPVDKDPDAIVAACDTAESGEDALAMPIAYVYGDEAYIVDVVFDDSPAIVTKPQCVQKIMEHKVAQVTFEANNAGSYYARDVEESLRQHGYVCNIRSKRTLSNKQTRMEVAAPNIIRHFYFKDRTTYRRGSQYDFFMQQVVTHTRVTKKGHDDAPDSLALLENELRGYLGTTYEVMKRPF